MIGKISGSLCSQISNWKYLVKRCYSIVLLKRSDKKFQDYLTRLNNEFVEITKNEQYILMNKSRAEYLHEVFTLKAQLEECQKCLKHLEDLLCTKGAQNDDDLIRMAKNDQTELIDKQNELEEKLFEILTPPSDVENYNEIELCVTCGAGGQESMLFAKDLFDMYANYATYKGWTFSVDHCSLSELGGIKHSSVSVVGQDVFKCLRFEGGIHRVQRVPATERTGRMHTSTCSVTVAPQPTDVQVDIAPGDLRVELKRSSGPGGQNVNKRETCVRLIHIPTGISAECQEEREQYKNHKLAYKRLRTMLFQREFDAEMSKHDSFRKLQIGNRERSEKIRTYNYPNKLVTDHRIKEKFNNLDEILLGGERFDEIVKALLRFNRMERLLEILEQNS